MILTKAQTHAIKHRGRNLQLIACAGSGKTEVVSRRVAYLLTKPGKQRLEPRNIVAFTFTEKAAAELKARIISRTHDAVDTPIIGMAEMYVGTIHGFCQELLQQEVPEYLKYEVLDATRQQLYINRKSKKTGLTQVKKLNGTPLRLYQETGLYIAALSVLREDDLQPMINGCSIQGGLDTYRAQLQADSYFDFSSMLEIAVNELTNNEDLRRRISERVKYVVVDEYQDVNPIQERLIRLLHDLGAGICVVGDDDQAIYQWRGSSVDNIQYFQNRYPRVGPIQIEDNYRSSEGIIETAHQFIEKLSQRLPKQMKYARAQEWEKGDIVALRFESPEQEAEHIVKTIESLRGVAFHENDSSRGLSYSDMAILLRSVKNNGAVITNALKEANIPFVVSGLANLFETDEARAARDLFYYIADQDCTYSELRRAWLNPRLGLAKADVSRALRYAKRIREDIDAGKAKTSQRIQPVFLKFLELTNIREEKIPDPDQRSLGEVVLFNLGKFSQVISDWESINFNSDIQYSFNGFANFLYYHAGDLYSEGWEDADYLTPDAVQIMTVHQAKGREWPVVFLPALLRNRFPSISRKSTLWNLIPRAAIKNSERYDGSTEDERRLFYVAMTRSKKFLHMTWAPISGKNNWYVRPSEFWHDVLASKWVKRRKPNYANRERLPPRPLVSVTNVELSFSDLKYLFECGYQFKLRVLYGFKSPIVPQLGFGKSLHDALAEAHQKAMRGEEVSESDVPDLVHRHLRTPYAFGEMRENLERAASRNIKDYINDNADNFQFIEFSEQPVEINLEEGVTVKGRIDLVRRIDTGETTIVDLKSNERSQQEDLTEAQLHTYALGYRELTGRDADQVEVYQLDERKAISRAIDEDIIEEIVQDTLKAASNLRNKRFDPDPTTHKCMRCDFRALCSSSLAPPHNP